MIGRKHLNSEEFDPSGEKFFDWKKGFELEEDKDGNMRKKEDGEPLHKIKTEGREEIDAWLAHHVEETKDSERVTRAFKKVDQEKDRSEWMSALRNMMNDLQKYSSEDDEISALLTELREQMDAGLVDRDHTKRLVDKAHHIEKRLSYERARRSERTHDTTREKVKAISSLRMNLEKGLFV